MVLIQLHLATDLPPKNRSSYYVKLWIEERGDLNGQKELHTRANYQ